MIDNGNGLPRLAQSLSEIGGIDGKMLVSAKEEQNGTT